MTSRVLSSLLVVFRSCAALAAGAAAGAHAGPSLLPATPQPILPAFARENAVKLDAPKLEPLDLAALLGPNLIEPGERAPDPAPVLTTAEQHAAFVDYVRAFEGRGDDTAVLAERIEYAVALLHVGRPGAAIRELNALEAEFPGHAETATSLATAHELAGNLGEAVVWLARSIERTRASPHGAEWLHAAILRAKLKLRADPEWLGTHSVLDGAEHRSAEEIVRAIDYQLGERLRFARPPDATLCDLFYQAALRVSGDAADFRRRYYVRESLRFGDWRKADIARLPRT